jgi:flagellar hook assembly protein FlgD
VSPKPDSQGQVRFGWGTTIPADEVFIKIYTSGFRIVREFQFNKDQNPENLTAGTHDLGWDGKDEEKRPMSPGVYLCFIDVNVDKKRYETSGKTVIP